MGRFKGTGQDSEEFDRVKREDAGPVECWVKDCQVKFGQGNKGQALHVCIECIGYYCSEHLWRHPDCSEGR